jgi:hypothetical protein
MKDSGKDIEKPEKSAGDNKKVLELTPEMEIGAEKNKPIYDLTEDFEETVLAFSDEVRPTDSKQNSDRSGITGLSGAPDPISLLLSESIVEEESAEATLQPGQESAIDDADEEPIIDLEDIWDEPEVDVGAVGVPTDFQVPDADEEVIIDLEDIADEPEVDLGAVGAPADFQVPDADEEVIIDLEDIADEPEVGVDAVDAPTGFQALDADEDAIIDLEEIVDDPDIAMEKSMTMADASAIEAEGNGIIDLVNKVELADGPQKSAAPSSRVNRKTSVSEEISEEVIENYIRTKYQGNIEALIEKVIEKTVQREITAIRHSYLEDRDG